GGVQTGAEAPQLSRISTENWTMPLDWPGSAQRVISAGTVIWGACVSVMITLKLQPATLLPCASDPMQCTTVEPIAKKPGGGLQATDRPVHPSLGVGTV